MLTNHLHTAGHVRCRRGLTLIEMTVVIVILITLVGLSVFAVNGYREYQLASEASQKLRMVYNAQRTYLSEHPTEQVSTLTNAKVIPYFSDKTTVMPTAEGLDGNQYNIKVSESPPYLIDGDGARYDPSGSFEDGMWDVGG